MKYSILAIATSMFIFTGAPTAAHATGPRACDIEGTCDPYQPNPNLQDPPASSQPSSGVSTTVKARVPARAVVAAQPRSAAPANTAQSPAATTESTPAS